MWNKTMLRNVSPSRNEASLGIYRYGAKLHKKINGKRKQRRTQKFREQRGPQTRYRGKLAEGQPQIYKRIHSSKSRRGKNAYRKGRKARHHLVCYLTHHRYAQKVEQRRKGRWNASERVHEISRADSAYRRRFFVIEQHDGADTAQNYIGS